MIVHFAHKGLKRLYERGDRSGIRQDMVGKVERVLQRLDEITAVEQMDLPGYRLHALSGDLRGYWSITITGNWRMIFQFVDGDVRAVDLVDYH